MIGPDAEPIERRNPMRRIDLRTLGWPKVITREQILDNIYRVPDPHYYKQCPLTERWTLRE
jgi:hypothetical protein